MCSGGTRPPIGAASDGLALRVPTRGKALSEDTPPERTPWAVPEAGTRGDVERRVRREYQVPIGAVADGLALRVPTRGKAQSEDIPTERTPYAIPKAVTCVVVER